MTSSTPIARVVSFFSVPGSLKAIVQYCKRVLNSTLQTSLLRTENYVGRNSNKANEQSSFMRRIDIEGKIECIIAPGQLLLR